MPAGLPYVPHRRRADVEDLCGVAERDLDRLELARLASGAEARRRDEEVQQRLGLARSGHQHVAAGARSGQQWLGDPRHEHGGDRGVDRVATLTQDARAGLRGERMAGSHHAVHTATIGCADEVIGAAGKEERPGQCASTARPR